MLRFRVIGADSMGVRSLATLVDCDGLLIGVDLGAALAPVRFGLPPHELELARLEEVLDAARRALAESQVVVITHYHYDHYMRDEPELYEGKLLIVKDPNRNINFSQKMRSYRFLKKTGLVDRARVEPADGRVFEITEGLRIEVSPPVWHGEVDSAVGRVVMARVVCRDESLIFASDVQGPVDREALEVLTRWSSASRPKAIIIGGPATYLEGSKIERGVAERGLANLLKLIEEARPETLIVDHHLLRDENYKTHLAAHANLARELGVRLLTGAEHEGKPVEQLEARRRELWGRRGGSRGSYS